jgi:lysophospholipase L1-like esterase
MKTTHDTFFRLATCVLVAGTLLLGAYAASLRPDHSGSPRDPDIRYIGRWDRSNPVDYHGYWSNVYLRTCFTGTSVGIKLASGTQLVVSIDGEPDRTVNAGAGVTALNAAPLKPGTHTLLVGSAGQNYEVEFAGLILDKGAKTLAAPPHPLIEFIGDSITVIFGDGNYSWKTGEALNCDHTQMAFSGVALTSGFGCSTKVGEDVQYFRLKNFNHLTDNPPVPWDFGTYTPQVIVINLGQNDQCGDEPGLTMTASYENFVRAIRSKFPQTQIVVLRPFGGPYAQEEQAAAQELIAGGDSRVHYVDTTGWLDKSDFIDGIHPNPTGQAKVVQRLIPILRPLLTENGDAPDKKSVGI